MRGKFSKDNNIEKTEREAVDKSTKAMVINTSTCRFLVHTSRTINLDWSTGLAWNVMCRLQKKYKPEDTISAVVLKK